MVHVAVNKYDFEKINILEYAFGEGGGGHQKAYAVYAFINVDNCERPLTSTFKKYYNLETMLRIIRTCRLHWQWPFLTADTLRTFIYDFSLSATLPPMLNC